MMKITVYLAPLVTATLPNEIEFSGDYRCDLTEGRLCFRSVQDDEPNYYFNWDRVIYYKAEQEQEAT